MKTTKILTAILISICVLIILLPNNVNSKAALGIDHSSNRNMRIDEPLEEIIADLEAFVPEYMAQEGVPGVAIALVRDGRVVWTQGFGVVNRLTRQAVTPETTFEVASNSKVVSAYIALRLVDQGLLSLDEPLDSYLDEPVLSQGNYREDITLRRTLSHTAGMGHNSIGMKVILPPGEGYYYSAHGFIYTQEVLEELSDESLEELAIEMVFEPLGMQHSSFVRTPAVMETPASGHITAVAPAVLFGVPFMLILSLGLLLGLIWARLRTLRWRLTRRAGLVIYLGAFLIACLLWILLGAAVGTWDYSLLVILWGFVMAGVFLLALVMGMRLVERLFPGRPAIRGLSLVAWTVLVLVALAAMIYTFGDTPMPGSTPIKPSAAGTMRATVTDMARFLIEIADPKHLSPELAAEMRTSQVSLRRDLSWGLGPGIQHSTEGDALWQWGQAPGFQSVMIIYPELGYGVVVLTNSDLLNPDVAINIAQRALGGRVDAIRRASHLEFNHRGPYIE